MLPFDEKNKLINFPIFFLKSPYTLLSYREQQSGFRSRFNKTSNFLLRQVRLAWYCLQDNPWAAAAGGFASISVLIWLIYRWHLHYSKLAVHQDKVLLIKADVSADESIKRLIFDSCWQRRILDLRQLEGYGEEKYRLLANALQSPSCPTNLLIDYVNMDFGEEIKNSIVAFIKVLKSGNCPSGLTFNIRYCTSQTNRYIANKFAKLLKTDNYFPQLKLIFNEEDAYSIANLSSLFDALKLGVPEERFSLTLDCRCNNFKNIVELANALRLGKFPADMTLNITVYQADLAGIQLVTEVLQFIPCKLGLQFNFYERTVEDEIVFFLADTLSSELYPSGLRLGFSYCTLSYQAIQALFEALTSGNCPERLSLDLRHTALDSGHIYYLAEALKKCSYLNGLELNLSNNKGIGNFGAKLLAEALSSGNCPPNLKLVLKDCSLADFYGADYFAKALQSGNCPPGLSLNLGYDVFLKDVTVAFSQALISGACPSGLTLKLGTPAYGQYGAQLGLLIAALRSENCPPGLRLSLKRLHDDYFEDFILALKSGELPANFELDFSHCIMSLEQRMELIKAWQYQYSINIKLPHWLCSFSKFNHESKQEKERRVHTCITQEEYSQRNTLFNFIIQDPFGNWGTDFLPQLVKIMRSRHSHMFYDVDCSEIDIEDLEDYEKIVIGIYLSFSQEEVALQQVYHLLLYPFQDSTLRMIADLWLIRLFISSEYLAAQRNSSPTIFNEQKAIFLQIARNYSNWPEVQIIINQFEASNDSIYRGNWSIAAANAGFFHLNAAQQIAPALPPIGNNIFPINRR